jgi:glutathione peroxidase
MKSFVLLFSTLLISILMTAQTSLHDFKVTALDGSEIDFSAFKGRKVLIVNTASECGYTPQYAELQELHAAQGEKLAIVGFPANNFGGQEPGDNAQIKDFCQKNYGVSFVMASKVSVKGSDQHPLFKWMTSLDNPDFTGDIRWNFEKFLFDENGVLVHRYRSGVSPTDKKITGLL